MFAFRFIVIVGVILLLMLSPAAAGKSEDRLYHIASETERSLNTEVSELGKNRVILVGEQHNDARHHANQLAVIRALHRSGAKVAVGLEMFRKENQEALDDWIGGNLKEKYFEREYYANWNYPWDMYREIFIYARENKIPMIGLNVSREITRQVAYHGFNSLSEKQRGELEGVTCRVDKEYMAFIRRAFGAHGHGQLNFQYFCEAQMVWDNVMAINTINFLKDYPDHTVVIVAGNGHAWKGGIPEQISSRTDLPVKVILPEVEGSIGVGRTTPADADYIFLK